MNLRLALVVDEHGRDVLFDGQGICRTVPDDATVLGVAVLDPAGTRAARARRFAGVSTIDVGAILRALGLADGATDVLRAAGIKPSLTSTGRARALATALWKLAWAKPPADIHDRSVVVATAARNDIGIRVDREHAATLTALYRQRRDEAWTELHARVPALGRSDLRSEPAFRSAIGERFNVVLETTAMGSSTGPVGGIVDARQRFIAFTDAAAKMQSLVDGPERIVDFLIPHGAVTGRFTSGGFSMHNLPSHPRAQLGNESLTMVTPATYPRPGRGRPPVAALLVLAAETLLQFMRHGADGRRSEEIGRQRASIGTADDVLVCLLAAVMALEPPESRPGPSLLEGDSAIKHWAGVVANVRSTPKSAVP